MHIHRWARSKGSLFLSAVFLASPSLCLEASAVASLLSSHLVTPSQLSASEARIERSSTRDRIAMRGRQYTNSASVTSFGGFEMVYCLIVKSLDNDVGYVLCAKHIGNNPMKRVVWTIF